MKREFSLLLLVVVVTLVVGCPTTVPGEREYWITIENHTDMELTELYISPCGESYWGDNWLVGSIDPWTSHSEVLFANQCWDIRIVSEYGNTMTTQLFLDSAYLIPVYQNKSGQLLGESEEAYWEDGDFLLKEYPPPTE